MGHTAIETNEEVIDMDSLWREYEHEEGFFIPENIMKPIFFVASKIVFIGSTLALWIYPYGLVLGVVLTIISIINFQWFLYPFLFLYVLYEERNNDKKF